MKEKLKQIKLILFDVDGVFCSGDISYLGSGGEIKTFDSQDGMGIYLSRMAGLKTGIITGRSSSPVEQRAKELKIDIVYQGNLNKIKPYNEIKKKYNLQDSEICYIGDDLPDLPVLNAVGFGVAVANAREEVKAISDYITVSRGGRGAVREVIELILKRQNKFDVLINQLLNPGEK